MSASLFNEHSFTLDDDEVHVWYASAASPPDAARAAGYFRLLNDEEIRRHAAFVNEKAKLEYLVARAFVRTALGRYLGASPQSLRFGQNEFGRPELVHAAGAVPLRFNVSHSDGLVACAVAWGREIGVDVESRHSAPIDDEIARRHFATAEFEAYMRQPTTEARQVRFLEYWTLKEAYIKARGLGLQLPLEKFSCDLSRPDRVSLTIDPELRDDAATWHLARLKPPQDFTGAIAARVAPARPIQIREAMAESW